MDFYGILVFFLVLIATYAQVLEQENAVKVFGECANDESVYMDQKDCRRYIYCWKNQAYHFRCHNGFVFNPCEEKCVRLYCNSTEICNCTTDLNCKKMLTTVSNLNLPVRKEEVETQESIVFPGKVIRLTNQPGGGNLERVVKIAPITDLPISPNTEEGYLVRVIFNRQKKKDQVEFNAPVIDSHSQVNVKGENVQTSPEFAKQFSNVTDESNSSELLTLGRNKSEEISNDYENVTNFPNAISIESSLENILNATSKESSNEDTSRLLNETSNESLNETSTESLNETSTESLNDTSTESLNDTSNESLNETSIESSLENTTYFLNITEQNILNSSSIEPSIEIDAPSNILNSDEVTTEFPEDMSTSTSDISSTTSFELISTESQEIEGSGNSEEFHKELNNSSLFDLPVNSNSSELFREEIPLNVTEFENGFNETNGNFTENGHLLSQINAETVWEVIDDGNSIENDTFILKIDPEGNANSQKPENELREKKDVISEEIDGTQTDLDSSDSPPVCNISSLSQSLACPCDNSSNYSNPQALQDHCSHLRCHNGGMYLSLSNGHCGCVCKSGFSGQNCQHVTEKSTCTCANGGKCIRIRLENTKAFACECPLGYLGAFCQYPIESIEAEKVKEEQPISLLRDDVIPTDLSPLGLCREQKCQNNGICILNVFKDPKYQKNNCYCPPNYYGINCQHYLPIIVL